MRPRRSDDNIALVQAIILRSPTTSQTRQSEQSVIKRTTLRRILHHDLHLFPYKVQLTQKLLPVDKPHRWEWAQRVIEMAETDENV